MIFELVKYKLEEELPFNQHPALSDHFMRLKQSFRQFEDKPQVKGIISLFPVKPRKIKMEVLPFYSFSSNKTGYAALKLLEDVFAEFYLQTEILPVINPMHFTYIKKYKNLPLHIVRKFQNRGAVLYAS